MLEKIDGYIMKTRDYGETHKIVTIFSKRIGKFSGLAKGAKKTRSRMAAVTQPFIYGQFFVYLNKGLSTIQQGEIIHSYRPIREDIVKTAYVAYIMELTDKLMDEKSPDIFIFDQLFHTMKRIEEGKNLDVPVMMYELKMYKKGGFAPHVKSCTNCGNTQPPFVFSIQEGGLLCTRCRPLDTSVIPISNQMVKLLYLFSEVGIERVGSISVKEENVKNLRKILDLYYEQYGGYYLKTRKFLNQLDMLK